MLYFELYADYFSERARGEICLTMSKMERCYRLINSVGTTLRKGRPRLLLRTLLRTPVVLKNSPPQTHNDTFKKIETKCN